MMQVRGLEYGPRDANLRHICTIILPKLHLKTLENNSPPNYSKKESRHYSMDGFPYKYLVRTLMKIISCRKRLLILTLVFASCAGIGCSDTATMTTGNAYDNERVDKDVTDIDPIEDILAEDTGTPDSGTPDSGTPDTSSPDPGTPGQCSNFDLSGCSAPANAQTVGCTLGSCSYDCNAGYHDLNRDLGQANSDGCEYACTPTNNGLEICDGLDNNCDGQIDENLSGTYYKDGDGDGYGITDDSVQGCDAANHYSAQVAGDCNDNNASSYPGAPILECVTDIDYNCSGLTSCDDTDCLGEVCNAAGTATCGTGRIKCIGEAQLDPDLDPALPCTPTNGGIEICDGVDNDCNGVIDDGLDGTYYRDADGDGYGDVNDSAQGCDASNHYTATQGGDCVDTNSDVYPGAPILECGSTIDYNCNGSTSCADPACNGEVCGSGICQSGFCKLQEILEPDF